MALFEDLIDECKALLESDDKRGAADLAKKACGVIAEYIPTYKAGLRMYRQRISGSPSYTTDDAVKDVETLLLKMEAYRNSQERQMRIAELEAAGRGAQIIVSNSGNNEAHASASATADIRETIRAIDSCEGTDEELSALKAAVADLAAADRSEPERVCEKASRVLDLAKKGADTVKAVAPIVGTILSALGI